MSRWYVKDPQVCDSRTEQYLSVTRLPEFYVHYHPQKLMSEVGYENELTLLLPFWLYWNSNEAVHPITQPLGIASTKQKKVTPNGVDWNLIYWLPCFSFISWNCQILSSTRLKPIFDPWVATQPKLTFEPTRPGVYTARTKDNPGLRPVDIFIFLMMLMKWRVYASLDECRIMSDWPSWACICSFYPFQHIEYIPGYWSRLR